MDCFLKSSLKANLSEWSTLIGRKESKYYRQPYAIDTQCFYGKRELAYLESSTPLTLKSLSALEYYWTVMTQVLRTEQRHLPPLGGRGGLRHRRLRLGLLEHQELLGNSVGRGRLHQALQRSRTLRGRVLHLSASLSGISRWLSP